MSRAYVGVQPSDLVSAGRVFRLTISRGGLFSTLLSTGQALGNWWDNLASGDLAYPLSPRPETGGTALQQQLDVGSLQGAEVAVVDVKVKAAAPRISVAEFADDLGTTFVTVDRVEALSAAQATSPSAAAERQQLTTQEQHQRDESRALPLSTIRTLLILGLLLVVGVAVLPYLRKAA